MRHEDEVVAAVFSPDGTRIATVSKDGTARLWDAATLKPVGKPMRHEHPLGDSSFHPPDGVFFNSAGTRIVTDCDEAGLLRLWDAATGAPVGEAMPYKSNYAWGLSPDGKLLTTIEDKTLHTWDSATGKSLRKPLPPSEVQDIAVSPNRKRAVTIRSGKAQVWSVTTGKILHTLPIGSLDENARTSAAFSPDGKRIVTVVNWSVQCGTRRPASAWELSTLALHRMPKAVRRRPSAQIASASLLAVPTPATTNWSAPGIAKPASRSVIFHRGSCLPFCSIRRKCTVYSSRPMGCASSRPARIMPCGCGTPKRERSLGSLCVIRIAPKTESKPRGEPRRQAPPNRG